MAVGDEETRAKVLDHAERLLLRDGYAATTVQKIAKHAGLDLDTVSKLYPSKYQLVRALHDRAMLNGAQVSAYKRSDEIQATETDARTIFHKWGHLAKEVLPRVAPIVLLIRDNAATDRDMADLQRTIDEGRLKRMSENATRLERFGIDHARSRDILWLATSPELYEMLVVKRGWSVDAYGVFVEQMLASSLLQ